MPLNLRSVNQRKTSHLLARAAAVAQKMSQKKHPHSKARGWMIAETKFTVEDFRKRNHTLRFTHWLD
jgi:hypothetical protein